MALSVPFQNFNDVGHFRAQYTSIRECALTYTGKYCLCIRMRRLSTPKSFTANAGAAADLDLAHVVLRAAPPRLRRIESHTQHKSPEAPRSTLGIQSAPSPDHRHPSLPGAHSGGACLEVRKCCEGDAAARQIPQPRHVSAVTRQRLARSTGRVLYETQSDPLSQRLRKPRGQNGQGERDGGAREVELAAARGGPLDAPAASRASRREE